MERKMVRGLVIIFLAVVLSIAMTLPAGAGPAATDKVTEFYTAVLDAEGCFKLVFCNNAHLTFKDGKATETYQCEFVLEGGAGLGVPAIPESAMTWDEENTVLIDSSGCTVPIDPPYRWYSDVEDILNPDTCFMYTHSKDTDIADTNSSFTMVITPSGNANVTVKYGPPVFEQPDGSACP